MVAAVRDAITKGRLGAIAAAVMVSLAAQPATLDRHGPIAATR
jgi:hypothetical protein